LEELSKRLKDFEDKQGSADEELKLKLQQITKENAILL
jgi:hypothetical protein